MKFLFSNCAVDLVVILKERVLNATEIAQSVNRFQSAPWKV